MKFLCKCGKTIHDITDDLFYKGTIIADQDMASMSRSTYDLAIRKCKELKIYTD
jgi:hypothetical protein